jgi:hypothetical protein
MVKIMGIFIAAGLHVLRTNILVVTKVKICLVCYEEQLWFNESVVNILQHRVTKQILDGEMV